MTRSHDHDPAACEGCELTDGRRRFVASALAMAFAAALPVRLLHALDRRANEVRYPIPAGDSVSIDSTNEVIIVRWSGKAYAFNLACPHQNTAIRWDAGKTRFQCPKHKSIYTPEGVFDRAAGSIVTRKATDAHRLEIPEGGRAVSLFITGPKLREWGFHCPNGWRHWREFVDERDSGQVGRGCE